MNFKHLCVAVLIASVFSFHITNAQTVYTIAGSGLMGDAGDGGPATAAGVEMNNPDQVTVDIYGNYYIADEHNNSIRKVSAAGVITTIAGLGFSGWGFSGDGGPAVNAMLDLPDGIAVDGAGNVYISDGGNNLIRKINTSGIITTICGDTTLTLQGYGGDGGPATAALIDNPAHLAVDNSGNLYFPDFTNNCVRKIDNAGIITTIAGKGPDSSGFRGDGGPATNALLYQPNAVACDASGNIYILDAFNNLVRKVNAAGIITTIAGDTTLGWGYSGDGGPALLAQFYWPYDIAIDNATGDIYVADGYNNAVRKIDAATGIITSFVGNGTAGFNGDGLSGAATLINEPIGVIVYNGNLAFTDRGNTRIRGISTATSGIASIGTANNDHLLYPNPNDGSFTISGTVNDQEHFVTVSMIDVTGKILLNENVPVVNGGYTRQVNMGAILPPGFYYIKINSSAGNSTTKFILQ